MNKTLEKTLLGIMLSAFPLIGMQAKQWTLK